MCVCDSDVHGNDCCFIVGMHCGDIPNIGHTWLWMLDYMKDVLKLWPEELQLVNTLNLMPNPNLDLN